jgi:alpha-tubulin suppressor-like RCC1 family protein
LGDLGIGGSTFKATLPQQVSQPGATGWTLIGAGGDHTCATRTGHALYCWGYSLYGQLGLGSTTQQNLPKQVTA